MSHLQKQVGVALMTNYLTIPKFSEISGYSEGAIRQKINDTTWKEGVVWVKAPDNRILIIVNGYEQWVEKALASKRQRQQRSKYPSCTKEFAAENALNCSPPPLI